MTRANQSKGQIGHSRFVSWTLCAVALFIAQLVLMPASSALAAADVTGYWIDHTKRGAVHILPCNELKNTKSKKRSKSALCGVVYWMWREFDDKGRPLWDRNNVKRSKRRRLMCGLKIFGNAKRISRRVYDNGWIYDPDQGKYFDVELTLKSSNILQVKGYMGIKMLSKTFLWRRAPGQLKKCTTVR